MGEKTPEAVEITCPGCQSHFRLTPKNGRLPTSDVPCPKCSEPIPVPERSPDSSPDLLDQQVTAEAPAFGVMLKGRLKGSATDTGDDATDKAIEHLERLAAEFPLSSPSATLAGRPGGATNPFARDEEKTAAVSRSMLEHLAVSHTSPEPDEPDDESPLSQSWKSPHDPPTSPRLVPENLLGQLATGDSEATLTSTEIPAEKDPPRGLLSRPRFGADSKPLSELTETAEHKVPPVLTDQELTKERDISKLQAGIALSKAEPLHQQGAPPTTRLPAPPKEQPPKPAQEQPQSDGEESKDKKPSLAVLFKKARQRDKKSGGELRARLRAEREALSLDTASPDEPAQEKELVEGIEISVDELSAIVERSTSEPGLPKPRLTNPIWPPMPAITDADQAKHLIDPPSDIPAPAKPAVEPTPETPELPEQTPEHSGLFDGFDPLPSAEKDDSSQEPKEVSQRRGKTTTQSMLARLQRRQDRGDNLDAFEIGAASERRGSGYIRLPTSEIQEVLGHGDFRLRIQDVIYEPVDRDGLTQLIKSGVLLGAEEIAEADGDWMPVSEHPVFGELRRKMAAEAHDVLARLGATQRSWAVEPPPTPDLPPTPQKQEASEVEELTDSALIDMSDLPPAHPPKKIDEEPSPDSDPDDLATTVSDEQESKAPQEQKKQDEEEDEDDLLAPAGDDQQTSKPDAAPAPSIEIADPELEDRHESISAKPERVTPPTVADVDDLDETPLELPAQKGKTGLIVAALAVVIGLGAAFFVFGDDLLSIADDDHRGAATTSGDHLEPAPELKEAIALAAKNTVAAIPDAFGDESRADAWARQQLEEDSAATANEILHAQWLEGRRDQEFLHLFLDALLQEEDFITARRVALAGIEYFPADQKFVALHQQAIRDDQRLTSIDPLPLLKSADFQAKGLLNEQGQQGFILKTQEGLQVFKPAREDWSYGWRAEIAAWRFCELIACHFAIPRTEPAVMSRAFLEELTGDTQGYDQLASSALWVTFEVEGEEMEVMRGSLELLPAGEPAPFPIEYRPLWLNWLHAGASKEDFSNPFSGSIDQLTSLAEGAFVDGLHDQLRDATTSDIARQVSSLLVFDYLTNNWERFATNPEDYGAANPAINGVLYSRNNGDAFQPRASRRVQGRFEWTTRFSQSMVTTIRSLDPELATSVLFPEELLADRARRDVLWSQRQDFLRRLDELIARHGEDEILAFP